MNNICFVFGRIGLEIDFSTRNFRSRFVKNIADNKLVLWSQMLPKGWDPRFAVEERRTSTSMNQVQNMYDPSNTWRSKMYVRVVHRKRRRALAIFEGGTARIDFIPQNNVHTFICKTKESMNA